MSQTDTTASPTKSIAPKGAGLAFAYVTTLFFAWGFATSLVDPLIAAVRGVFELSFTEALLTQFAWFTAYGVFSLPAAAILSRLGYAKSIVSALGVMVIGALIVPVSTLMNFYPGVLIALFVIGGGVTLLQVAANPLAASLGSPGKSHFRLVLSQAFNSLGTVVGPLLGATVMLSGGIFVAGGVTELASFEGIVLLVLGLVLGAVAGGLIGALKRSFRSWLILGAAIGLGVGWLVFLQHYVGQVEATGLAAAAGTMAPAAPSAATLDPALRAETLRNIDSIFFVLAVLFAALGGFIWLIRSKLKMSGQAAESGHVESPLKALSSKWAVAGAAAIFVYVGSEVSIGSLMTNLLHSEGTLGLRIEDAGRLVALYWAGALMGRFAGSALLTRAPAAFLLTVCTVAAAVLSFVVFQSNGATAAFAALSIGLFNSIMFPTIFTLTLERSTAPASATSGLLVFGIIGGALLPLLAGSIADTSGNLNHAFIVPLIGYVLLTIFAVAAMRTRPVTAAGVTASSH
ncbi:MAG TPA: glucose/galactose MFS transporter [Brevundimonas sp.]|jgi:FHS family L-fucose permease-like MFS transporter